MQRVKSIEVIINATSGSDDREKLRRHLHELFNQSGVDVYISVARKGAEVPELARVAVARSDVIVAGGGDGTVNAVAAAVVANHKTLGVLPLGTLNHFARDLNISLELESAVQIIVAGATTKVDVGEVNGRIFLNTSSLGLYPSIVREREKQQRLGHGKWPAFAWAALSVLRRHPFLDVRLSAPGKQVESRTLFVFIGNNEYAMEGFNIGVRKSLDSGVLSVYITLRTGRWGLIRLALRALLGRLHDEKDFLSLTTDQAWVETRRKRLRVALDGEVQVIENPLHYRMLQKTLRVIVPTKENQ